jgi:hypothetical protein
MQTNDLAGWGRGLDEPSVATSSVCSSGGSGRSAATATKAGSSPDSAAWGRLYPPTVDARQPTPIGRLALDTLRTAAIGVPILCALVFLPAGTLVWWQGWLFVFVFVASTNAIGIYPGAERPALLERRQRFGPAAEQRPAQRGVVALCPA